MKTHRILAINPGSTSTKIAVYDNDTPIFSISIPHSVEDLAPFAQISQQFEWRKELIEQTLQQNGIPLESITAVIGRGGLINPIESGIYEVNDDLVYDLLNAQQHHASNLGGLIARAIADHLGVHSYIADPVVVDEMVPYARITGIPEIPRKSIFHALNQKAVARVFAKETGKRYEDLNLVVCHMGGGCSVSAHRRGRVIDTTNALNGNGPFSPERAGSIPPGALVDLCFSGKYSRDEIMKIITGNGGLKAHLGTTSVPEILERIQQRDLHSMLVLRAMCYSIAKEIGAMAVALKGEVDAILLTGGIAHSKRVTDFMADYVDSIAPIYVYPGENELDALAQNALAAERGERDVSVYVREDYDDPKEINDTDRPSKLRDWLLAAITPNIDVNLNNTVSAIRHYIRKWGLPKG